MKISFSAEEKIKLLSTIRVWDRSQLTQDVFRKLQAKYGIPAYLVETMFWHMERHFVKSNLCRFIQCPRPAAIASL